MSQLDKSGSAVGRYEMALAGGPALRRALQKRSASEVLTVIKSMNAIGVAAALREIGFDVDDAVVSRGRQAVYSSVKDDLSKATALGVDGFGLTRERNSQRDLIRSASVMAGQTLKGGFAAKDMTKENAVSQSMSNSVQSVEAVQSVFRASSVSVEFLGDAAPVNRGALLLIANQAMKKGIQGFAFDGLPGKYEVPMKLADMLDLHVAASKAVGVESVRKGLSFWSAGGKVVDLEECVPNSIQRLLYGSVNVESAKAILNSIEHGGIETHAGEIGSHQYMALLARNGLDVSAKTVEQVANESGWTIKSPDRSHGQYFGPVVATDHRAVLVKFTRDDVIVLAYKELALGQERPVLRDTVRLDFTDGKLLVNVVNHAAREAKVDR